jgi:hypothetical protein
MISKSISEGFKFALSVNRVIPYIILDLIIFYLLISFFSSLISMIISESSNIFRFLLSLGLLIPGTIIIGLVQLLVNGAIIDQAKYFPGERSFPESFKHSTSRYLTMFCALIIYGVLSFIVSLPKYIGTLLVFAVALIFYYIYPAIIVDKKRCVDAFNKSYKTFRRYPLETFLTWLVLGVISLIIIGIFALPLIFLFLGNIINVWAGSIASSTNINGPQPFLNNLIPVIVSGFHSPFFVPYLFILVVGSSFSKVFNLGVQTRLYINARKMEL